jgi:sulfite exporter TauE/SafE
MSYQYLAFFMGLFGSLHCVAMCGPLVMALPLDPAASKWKLFANRVMYQFGRVSVYGVFGLLLGVLGASIALQGWQQALSIATGILLIAMALIQFFQRSLPTLIQWQQRLIQPLIKQMSKWLYRPGGSFFAGVLNGLLPCGMVYMALAAALNADTIWGAGNFMLFFGFGTLPLMLIFAFLGSYFKTRIRANFASWLPVLFLIMGVWFLLRGANLDIPFLSPMIYPDGAMNCA